MMGKALMVVVALALLVAFASARPIAFVGGSFTQARGHYSPAFAVYSEDLENNARKGWARHEATAVGFDGPILDMWPVGEGVFAVGAFNHLDGSDKPSAGVAFYDGLKWCAIRESLAHGGVGSSPSAVWCDSDTSCWVAGTFSAVNNVPDEVNTDFVNFARYTYDNVTNEWQFDSAVRAWNNNSASGLIQTLPGGAVPGTLVGLTNQTDNTTYFFVGVGAIGDPITIYRGSVGDNGWRLLAQNTAGVDPSTVLDFGFDTSSYPPVLYTLNKDNQNSDSELSSPWMQELLLAPCTHVNCDSFILQSAYINFAFIPRQQSQTYIAAYSSIWANNGTRYLIAFFDPDGTNDARTYRWVVMKQVGEDDPVALGQPFPSAAPPSVPMIYRVRGHPLNSEWAYVIGAFDGANLFFPPGDSEAAVTTDVSTDRRAADSALYVAQWRELGRWEQAFGGGFSPFGGSPDPNEFPIVYNPNSKQWFVAHTDIEFVYDIVANGAAWYDNAEDAAQPSLFPVLTHALWRRPNQFEGSVSPGNQLGLTSANVFDFVCFSDCQYVYVAGDFNFHGNDTVGAVALVKVERTGDAAVQTVGGGLWYNDLNVVRDTPDLQFTSGAVYSLAREGDYLYAAGFFSRGKTGYVCLSNVARIRNSETANDDAQWEDLGGGCNDEVYDLQFWEGRLYAAGAFDYCGSRKVNFVADYTYRSGSNAEWNNLNNGVDGLAYSIEPFGGRLIFAGEFHFAGGLPVTGVAAWNTAQWRPLLPACTDDCVPGDLQYYFNVLNTPRQVYNLQAAKDGNFLYARASFGAPSGPSSSGSLAQTPTYLARWEYFQDQDLGIWTVKGPQALFTLKEYHKRADGVFVNNGTLVVVGGTVPDSGLTHANQDLHTWDDHSQAQNWLGTHLLIAPEIYVIRSSASTLSSPLAFLLSAF